MVYLLENDVCVPVYAKGRIYADMIPLAYNSYDPYGANADRNAHILTQYADGVSIAALANQYGLTPQRVYQIIQGA
jgi:hypothetical protein